MKQNKKGNSILIAILVIGFLLVLVVGMFNLMLRDMKDNRWAWNYLKSYAGAEWAMELGLLKIKEKWYWVDEDLEVTNSWILSFNSTAKRFDPKISYKMDIWVKSYTGSLWSLKTVIIPLFSNNNSVKKPELTDNSSWNIIWNIIWDWEWMSWSWNFDFWDSIYYKNNSWSYEDLSITEFLKKTDNEKSYLMLFNKWSSEINYKLDAESNFSKPVWTIISSVQVWKFRQNITTDIDNTEFLSMLKYSLFSK